MSPLDHHISPRFRASKASPGAFGDWVDIWEDRIWGWQLEHAERLLGQGHDAAFAALHLAVAFVEPYEVFRAGESSDGKSRRFFKSGFSRIFNASQPPLTPAQLDAAADALYTEVRCGLFHGGMTGTKVYVSNAVSGIEVQLAPSTNTVRQILLNPESFVRGIVREFRQFVARLRNPADPEYLVLKANFEKAWHLVHAGKVSHQPGAV